MEEVLQTLGVLALVLLAAVGALAGWIAALAVGGNRALYVVVGIVAALAAPFLAAALGLAALVASGLVAVLVTAAVFAAVVLVLVRLLSRRRP